ncbi:MAG: nucleoside deaminase [Bacteroidales bacterium]|nr:nucleoside deaminase [Bacteroidales bacterium]MDY4175301.1 nucleoside deaminase [Bacteroidales bacterium]
MSLSPDDRWMAEAIKEAELAAAEGEIPCGAVVVCGGRIVGRGHNMTERLADVTAHAEILAMTAAAQTLGSKYLNDCTLYVTLEPCTMCAGALAWAQIGRIVYAASDPKRGYARLAPSPLHPKTQVTSGVCATEAAQLVKLFFKSRR